MEMQEKISPIFPVNDIRKIEMMRMTHLNKVNLLERGRVQGEKMTYLLSKITPPF